MNKAVITQYKDVFDFWLKSGTVLYRYKQDSDFLDLGWMEMSDTANFFSANCFYVQDDKYAKYRKALADGKTIQYNPCGGMPDAWEDMRPIDTFNRDVRHYRIKPDKPPFKVGDWIRIKAFNKVLQLSPYTTSTELSCIEFNGQQYFLDDIELWKPKINEWCWFWNNDNEVPFLCQLAGTDRHIRKYLAHNDYTGNRFQFCEPFIGTLPTNLL